MRVSTEAEATAVIGAEWPLRPLPDALTAVERLAVDRISELPAAPPDVEAWLEDAEFPDEETAPTQPGMRFERDALPPVPDGSPAPRRPPTES